MMTGQLDEEKKIESLRSGAYAILAKPFKSYEEVYHITNNAANHYLETLRTTELTAEIEKRHEHERLNLLELDFLKKLQLMIGETEDPTFVIKNSFALLKNFLNFSGFCSAYAPRGGYKYPDLSKYRSDPVLMDCITKSLMNKVPERSKIEKQMNELLVAGSDTPKNQETKYNFITIDISARDKIYGYAGLYRVLPFMRMKRQSLIDFVRTLQ